MSNLSAYLLVLMTVACTVYGQLIIKWHVLAAGKFPAAMPERIRFMAALLVNPWIISAFVAAFLASLTWMAAMTKLPISQAYPLNSMTFIFVVLCGGFLFSEPLGMQKFVGVGLIIIGIIVASQGPR
ncbi:MAG: EamA family transporter [Granulicella sp.]